MHTITKSLLLLFLLSTICHCKRELSIALPKKVYGYLESKDPLDLSEYKKAQKIDFKIYMRSIGIRHGNYLTLSEFSSMNNPYYEILRTPFFRLELSADKKSIELHYDYADEMFAIGKLVEIRCLAFTESYKDCLLTAKLEVDYWGEEERQIILRSNDNILFYIYSYGISESGKQYSCRANDFSGELEARKRIGACLKILRDTPGHPPLESLVYDKESVDYFLEAVKD
jgi:hypothetical protein